MTKNQKEQIEIIADNYGIEKQLFKTREELLELNQEVEKYLFDFRNENDNISTERIVDEIADVKIMLAQLEYLLELEEEVKDRVEFKLNRQMNRIELEKENV